jgi:16S rRNA (cytosine1402-N4)-methyltransferase
MNHEYHTPVLVDEVLHYLHAESEGVYVDGTLGGGGHTESLLMKSPPGTRVVVFDVDTEALQFSQKRLNKFVDRVVYIHDVFSNMKNQLAQHKLDTIDGVLLDLGISSHQIDSRERGFSFQHEGRLDMRMNQERQITAASIVNTYDVRQLTEIFRTYGEERYSGKIARKIVDARKKNPVETTHQLSSIVESAVGRYLLQKSLARVFQAIRIEVNNELEHLRQGLQSAFESLRIGGRLVVISYHSLEDRIVKEFFVRESSTRIRASNKLLPDIQRQPRVTVLTRKPVCPGSDEISKNPRARSAKLRAAEKIAA